MYTTTLLLALLAVDAVSAVPTILGKGGKKGKGGKAGKGSGSAGSTNSSASAFPFQRIVAFGDDYTDNGQGSYTHGITGDETTHAGAHLWGANTWTDGPVAVTDLSNIIGLPLTYDYAFGSSMGGGQIGSVCDNSLLQAGHLSGHAKLLTGAVVPGALQQVANYTSGGVYNKDVADTLHFVWTGNNDMIASLGWAGRFTICDKDTLCHPAQQVFLNNLLSCFTNTLTNLLKAGAKHIIVPNIFPRQYAPWMGLYISQEAGMVTDFGNVINQANTRIQQLTQTLSTKYSAKVMYYDANGYMLRAMANPSLVQGAAYNYTCVDGCTQQIPGPVSNWNLYWNRTIVNHQPDAFFWMTTVVASATVMQNMAQDMANFLQTQY